MSNFEGTFELKSPLTKECWDKLADVELENTERMWFTTPSEKRVEYIKASVLDKIRAEILSLPTGTWNMVRRTRVLDIIDKYRAESESKG